MTNIDSMIDTRHLRWDELSDEVDKLGVGWLFRGQRDAAWALVTSLEFHTPSTRTRSSAEAELLGNFRRRAHNYLPPHQMPLETGEWLAMMQHFGAPTRLLDVTASPYVAIYFAVEDAIEPGGECAVWAVNRFACATRAGTAVLNLHPEVRAPLEADIAAGRYGPDRTLPPEAVVGYMQEVALADNWLNIRVRTVVPFRPDRLSDRLSIQQGEFLIPRDVDATFMENLLSPTFVGNLPGVIKFVISNRERPRILEQLRSMNISRASLFPGLEGFAQSYRQSLIAESPEEKRSRQLRRGILRETSGGALSLLGALVRDALETSTPPKEGDEVSGEPSPENLHAETKPDKEQ